MFKIYRQPQGENAVKKSIQKLIDPKKDVITRLKHLRNVIDNSPDAEVQSIFELHYSHIYFIFFENFLIAEANLRQKGSHRAQREELDAILVIFEQILINLPKLIHQRWQYHSIDTVIKRLLHTQNSLKVRRDGMNFFLLWLRALRQNALPRTLLLYACLVPGFPPPTFRDGKPYSLEWLVNMPINEEYGVHQVEISCLVPPSSGEKSPSDLTKYFLDSMLEFMVQTRVLRWEDPQKMATESFSFLWDLFKEHYLPHAFTDFNFFTSIYTCNLSLPEPRESVNYVLNVSDSGSLDPRIEVASGCSMLAARVSIIKWVVAFTGRLEKEETIVARPDSKIDGLQRQLLKQLQELNGSTDKVAESSEGKSTSSTTSSVSAVPSHIQPPDTDASNSNTSTLTEKEPSLSSLSSLDDKLRSSADEEIVREVLYSTRQNINIVQELFRQAFMLPLTEVPTMRRVVKVYQEWIQEGEIPIFMEDASLDENPSSQEANDSTSVDYLQRQESSSSIRNTSYMRGQLRPVIDEALSSHVRAGPQSTHQLFITNSAHVFLVEPPRNAPKLVQAQVDVCKRVLNLYRFVVMNGMLSDVTWRQLLRVLLHITRVMLQEIPSDDGDIMKHQTVAGRLAGPVFQTLIVSWIKANLFVHVSRELWNELVDVLSSLNHWVELITEWAKNMETMTRVLSRHVYKLELQDLPLDRLTEQKHKKQKKAGSGAPLLSERSFSRGWSRDSLPANEQIDLDVRRRSRSAYVPRFKSTDEEESSSVTNGKSHPAPEKHDDFELRQRSKTIPINVDITAGNIEIPPRRGVSDTAFITSASSLDSNGTLRRHNSASDIPALANDMTSGNSPARQRSDSEGRHSQDRGRNMATDDNGPHVAWQEPAHEIHNYLSGSVDASESASISVNSLVEADEMFDELIQERLHGDDFPDKDRKSRELWPSEATSLHSQDSASIDPDWNPWADPSLQHSSEELETPSVERLPMEFTPDGSNDHLSHSDDLKEFSQVELNGIIPSVGIPVPTRRFTNEDVVDCAPGSNPSDSPTFTLPTLPPLSQTPPAIPARKALPPHMNLNLCDIDVLSPSHGSSDFAIPSYTTSDAGDISPCDPPYPINPPVTVHIHPSSPITPSQSGTHFTNATQSNSNLNAKQTDPPGLSDSIGSVLTSPPYQLYQNTSQQRNDSSALLLPDQPPSFDLSGDEKEEGTNSAENHDILPHDLSAMATASTEDVVSVETMEMESDLPGVEEKDEDDLLATSTEDILMQHCSTPHTGISKPLDVDNLGDSTFDDGIPSLQNYEDFPCGTDECSIMAGGKLTGWFPDVAVALWRRLLGILGDVNEIEDSYIHELVFNYLLELWNILFKLRQNIGIAGDNQTSTDSTELVPPLRILAPWAFKASMALPDTHKGGKLHAHQLLCKMTIQREHDTPLEPEHLSQFYAVLHESLHCADQDIVNEVVGSCSQYFSSCLPASTLLLLDFIYACHTVAASPDLKAPRVEAQTILGSTLCFPNLYHDIPVLKPDSTEPSATICNNVKDYVVEALLTSGKKEPSAAARCVALSSTGLWLYEELTSKHQRHSRVKEAINVLLVSLKFNNRSVASVACTQLHLLTHCSNEILKTMHDMPPRIIEVMSLTVSALLNASEAKNTESGRHLLVSLLLCILDWCMAVPLELLTDTYGVQSDKRLIRTVFKALQTAALGKPGHSAKHSYSLSDLASQDFDPNLELDKVQETPTGVFGSRSKQNMSRSSTMKFGKDGAVSLAAHTVLSHLTNHLGHFPLARGTAVLTCLVSEHHDIINAPGELTATLFNSPEVQFMIFNDTCLLSVVEIPSEDDKPGGGPTAGMSTSKRCVRFIVRDAGGKYCWDSSILYGPPDVSEATMPVSCKPLSKLDAEISRAAKESCQSYIDYANEEEGKKRKVSSVPLPNHDVPISGDSPDKLDQLLQYIGYSSPECQTSIGRPLNIPAVLPTCLNDELQSAATQCLTRHHESMGSSYAENAHATSWQCCSMRPDKTIDAHSSFYHARLLLSEMGFLSRDNRHRINLLKKNERLLRELKNLDSRHCRETHKVAVLYIAEGQEDKLSVLSNTGGSREYEEFVAGLGWEVDLSQHCGFRGKLQSDGSTGRTSPYYATSTLEVVFHVATRFPSSDDDARNVKIRHLGNDEVHIIWSEHHRDYRRGIIPTEFGDVLIVIYPIRHGLYRVQIIKKSDVPYFGPLFDGAVVNARILPVLVRETAINAGRAKRSLINLYQPFYEERTRYLRQIIDQFKDEGTFENYCAHLFCPAPLPRKSKVEAPKPPLFSGLPIDVAQIQFGASVTSPSDATNANNNSSAAQEHHNLLRDAAKRIPNYSISTQVHADQSPTDYLSVTSRSKLSPALSSPASHPSTSAVPKPSGSPSFFFPAPPTSLSSSVPGTSSKTPRHSSGGHKSHVSFRSNLLHRNSGGGSQPHLPVSRDFVDFREFPTPPQSPPTQNTIPNG